VLNFVAIDLQLYKILKIMRVSFWRTQYRAYLLKYDTTLNSLNDNNRMINITAVTSSQSTAFAGRLSGFRGGRTTSPRRGWSHCVIRTGSYDQFHARA